MSHFTPLESVLGGALIGAASVLLVLLNGRVSGISGAVGGLFHPESSAFRWRLAFVLGLIVGGAVLFRIRPSWFDLSGTPSLVPMAIAGFLVGVGTRLSGGCTSGHGVCGIGRLAPRSIVATGVFMFVAGATVWFVRTFFPEGL